MTAEPLTLESDIRRACELIDILKVSFSLTS